MIADQTLQFREVWIDPACSLLYLFLWLGTSDGRFEPAEGYGLILKKDNYDEAQFLWLENEYEADLKLWS
ncbi:MAG: hypothetical protein O4861_03400 [Trichodesmium sp. St16_bin4-tuft]|uniref:hypothetical protein n=1 Tax=Trichodesmium erythraeum TaxID=1206 RepID=UPI00003C9BF3|nr:hypothetical protein [Trichodesmium erythraeum GBRTRLIN201]MDE5069261.1 hypothetical protein [Trichodesmium sp. St4_bin8_1]MDE5073970.1 hypothetical protein [Trichodesmium sp. St5_bin8]MDE5077460.1 hypothetical protein [Trichodesmium sp. St2_bin6]MDE5091694.1 hypothetical protein [Trichodesmium sp. St18_bin3_1_1]MDE5097434.1 hypothetical protein [Trichodesmium sp. St16_bin4-tuft]MDE5105132.1 hypothetical protein [Trichodesmium sp. St19_bin2]MDT9340176.1 hypothetical protein [Trichodesmium